ncbi:MAG: hypothetical protein A2508_08120 [Candidatus Lambdaproteobacteria bacterium RIFOXYD12_FULL_49_8]|nr:MAG: hypothetical protein A2508_08120 [Candidatus Lambdaproteobacteria bacterium RIFOXYD12_FULL_49_8]
MNSKLFKSLAFSLCATLIGSTAFAQDAEDYNFKVTGKIRSFYGQYNDGSSGHNAYLTEFNEGNIAGSVQRGKMKGYYELESRADSGSIVTMRNVTYALDNGFNFGVGTFKNKAAFAFASDAGTDTAESSKFAFYSGLLTKVEGDGLQLGFKTSDLQLDLYTYESDLLAKTEGSTTEVGAQGKAGAISYRLSAISATTDNHQGGATAGSSGNHLGIQYQADSFGVAVDSAGKSVGHAKATTTSATGVSTTTAAYNTVYTDVALMATLNLGDDKLFVTLAQESKKDDTTGAKKTSYGTTNVVYSIPVAKSASINLAYASQSTTPEGGTATTARFFGLGLNISL